MAVLLTAGVAPRPAEAVTYYVRPGGSDANDGRSSATAWATIGKANTTVNAGDVIYVARGRYSQFPNPTRSGSSYTNRITYIGDIADTTAVEVPGGTLTNKSHVTLKGFRFTGGFSLGSAATRCSLAYSSLTDWTTWGGASHNMMYRCVINGSRFTAGTSAGLACNADTLLECRVTLGVGVLSQPHVIDFKTRMLNCVFERNRFDVSLASNAVDVHMRQMYHMNGCTFRDNRWEMRNLGGPYRYAFNLRDSCRSNRFVRDTIFTSGDSRIALSTSGSYGRSVADNRYTSCFFRTSSEIWYQDGVSRDTIEYCIMASQNNALWLMGTVNAGPVVVDHNTFVGPAGGAVRWDGPWAWAGTLRFTNNIVYSGAPTTGTTPSAIYFGQTSLINGQLSSNNNLYAYYGRTSVAGDQSIGYRDEGGNALRSRPGTGNPWHQKTGQDANSIYGSPLFADSTFSTLNVRLRPGSPAIGRGQGGTDIGALQTGTGNLDFTPPANVADLDTLNTGETSVVLRWTAPGDDGITGTVESYDIRYSRSAITGSNFDAATPVAVPPAVVAGGTVQTYLLTGLTSSTSYYVAMKAVDEAGNWSGMSNVRQLRTIGTDITPPAATGDLRAE